MKYSTLTLGQIEALINKIGGVERVKDLLRGDLKIVACELYEVLSNNIHLVPSNIIGPARVVFREDSHSDLNVYCVNSKFQEWFFEKEEKEVEDRSVRILSTKRVVSEQEIFDSLESKVVMTLSEMYTIMRGNLLGDACYEKHTIFFIKDIQGVVRVVCVKKTESGAWTIYADDIHEEKEMFVGTMFIVPQ